jgi:hypothetical protein
VGLADGCDRLDALEGVREWIDSRSTQRFELAPPRGEQVRRGVRFAGQRPSYFAATSIFVIFSRRFPLGVVKVTSSPRL